MAYPATSFSSAVDLTITAANQIHEVVNGDSLSTILVETGEIPSLRKALVDNFYFVSPIDWDLGNDETVFNQLRTFTDGSVWWSPTATVSNPVEMTADPYIDSNWTLSIVGNKNYITNEVSSGDSQLSGGATWPLSSKDSAQVGDDLTGYTFIRLYGGDFPEITKFSVKDNERTYTFNGTLDSVNLTVKPYTAVVGGVTVDIFPQIDGCYINVSRGMSSNGVELENRYFGTDTSDWSQRLYNASEFAVDNKSPIVLLGGGDKVLKQGIVIDGFVKGDSGLTFRGTGKYSSRLVFNPDGSNTNGVMIDVRGPDNVDTFQYAIYFEDMQFRGPAFAEDIVLGTHGLRVRQLQHPWGLKNVAFAGFDYGWEVGVSSDGGTFDDILATECNTILNLYGKDSDACVLSNSFFGGYYREAVRVSCNRSKIHSTFIGNPRDASTIDINIVRQLTRSEDLLLSNMTANGHNASGSRISYWSESANNITAPNVVIGDGTLVGDTFVDIHLQDIRFAKSGGDSRVAIQINQSTQGCKIYKNDFTGYLGNKIDITDGVHGLDIDQPNVANLLSPTSNARIVTESKSVNRVGQEVIPGLSITRAFLNPAGLVYKESQDFAYNTARTALTCEATTTGSATGLRYDIVTLPNTYRFIITAKATPTNGASELLFKVSDKAAPAQVRAFNRIQLDQDLKTFIIEVPCFSGTTRVELYTTSNGNWIMEPILFTGTRQSSLKTVTDGGVSSESAFSTIPLLRGQTVVSPSAVGHVAKRIESTVTGYTGTGAPTDTITVNTSGLETGMQVTLPIISGTLQTMDRVTRTIQSIGSGTIDVSPGVSNGTVVDSAFTEFYKYL